MGEVRGPGSGANSGFSTGIPRSRKRGAELLADRRFRLSDFQYERQQHAGTDLWRGRVAGVVSVIGR